MSNSANEISKKPEIGELTERVVDQIIDYANSNSLEVGTPLRTQSLADLFSVSRTPVSEALNYLKLCGVVRHLPQRGYELAIEGNSLNKSLTNNQLPESDLAYENFVEKHLRNEVPKKFTEASLRRTLNISQASLQSLLGRLLGEGLVEPAPGYGLVLNNILTSRESIKQSYRFRMMIEPSAILERSFSPDPKALSRLRSTHQAMLENGMTDKTPEQIFNINIEFHEAIIGWANNPFLTEALKKQNAMRRLLVVNSALSTERYVRILQEHLALLSALEENRFVDASLLMKQHLAANADNVEGF